MSPSLSPADDHRPGPVSPAPWSRVQPRRRGRQRLSLHSCHARRRGPLSEALTVSRGPQRDPSLGLPYKTGALANVGPQPPGDRGVSDPTSVAFEGLVLVILKLELEGLRFADPFLSRFASWRVGVKGVDRQRQRTFCANRRGQGPPTQ